MLLILELLNLILKRQLEKTDRSFIRHYDYLAKSQLLSFQGNVEIIADEGQQLELAKGECLENIKLMQAAHSKLQRIPL